MVFDAVVLGSGLSGLSIANKLNERGWNVLVADPRIAVNMDESTAGLVNPAMGRYAKPGWKSAECHSELLSHIQNLIKITGRDDFVNFSNVLRPAINEELALAFQDSMSKYEWPTGWLEWISPDDSRNICSDLAPNFGSLLIKSGFTIYAVKYLKTYIEYLSDRGVKFHADRAHFKPNVSGTSFKVDLTNGEKVTSHYLITATGGETPDFDFWKEVKLHKVKGQIAIFESSRDLDWDVAISSMGYTLRSGKRLLVAGSTYEHTFSNVEPDKKGVSQIQKKLNKMVPGAIVDAKMVGQIAGLRVTTPNKLPVIGRHPLYQNLCIYTGMGSRGLLQSEYTARLLADHLSGNIDIPADVDYRTI